VIIVKGITFQINTSKRSKTGWEGLVYKWKIVGPTPSDYLN